MSTIELDKDDWIYLYGSDRLQQARTHGYECNELYLKERLRTEHPGFKINERSQASKVDLPPIYAMNEAFLWRLSRIYRAIKPGIKSQSKYENRANLPIVNIEAR